MQRFAIFLLLLIVTPLQSAPFNLDTDSTLLYAREALTSNELKNNGSLFLSAGSDELNLLFRANFSLSQTARYIRIELENGELLDNLPTDGLTANPDYSSVLSQGGATGDRYAVIEVRAPGLIDADTEFLLSTTRFRILDISMPLIVTYTLYDKAFNAINDGPYITRTEAELARVVTGLTEVFAEAFTHKVGFGTDFIRFNPSFRSTGTFLLGDSDGELASLAKFRGDFLIAEGVRKASDSSLITDFRDLLVNTTNTSAATACVIGDLSAGELFLNPDNDCSGARIALEAEEGEKATYISLDTLTDNPVLCMDVTDTNQPVRRADYRLDLGLGGQPAFFGKIRYDGARIDLPYITNYQGYRQRIILNNHAGYDVAYKVELQAEEAVQGNFTPGEAVEGIIPAGTVLKIDGRDLVDIAPGVPTRVSARMLVDALPEDISAAVQVVSLGSNQPPVTNVLNVTTN
ncbi:hypothetical protein [Lacimicrobium alkaliphilum]|uniref:hypothetical protein n=1 Tax=Lacimicrobium alkaliphilum TaxID=1526571 RepID=UPI0012E3B752|nr:hypothetical protein [Lacimicrobium alkaliphilum]